MPRQFHSLWPVCSRVMPGSLVPWTYLGRSLWYHLGYCLDEEHALPATRAIAVEVNFPGMLTVKTGITNVAGHFYSNTRTVSQEVPAAVLQSHCSSTVYENQANKWRKTAVDGVDVALIWCTDDILTIFLHRNCLVKWRKMKGTFSCNSKFRFKF